MDGYWKPWAEDNYLISTSEKQAQLLAQITEGKKVKFETMELVYINKL